MRVINFFGGPGVGKSTLAAGLFHKMKTNSISAELVTEYAKDVTWEGRHNLFDDQIYLLAKQNRRLARLTDHAIEFAVTDSPLLLCAAYDRIAGRSFSNLTPLVLELFNSYNNINLVVERDTSFYVQVGRNQTIDQASAIDHVVLSILDEFNIPYTKVKVSPTVDVTEQLYNLINEM